MDLIQFEKAIKEDNIEKAISSIKQIGRRNKQALPLLIKHLKGTDNGILRNQIALALSDIGSQEAVEPIIEMLKDPKTLGYRGTLLYALKPFDYSAHIELLVDYMINGNFEVRHEAKQLIFDMNEVISDDSLQKYVLNVNNAIEDLEERLDFLSEALEGLFNLQKKN